MDKCGVTIVPDPRPLSVFTESTSQFFITQFETKVFDWLLVQKFECDICYRIKLLFPLT